MKLDRIDALALDVEILQHRRMAIGEARMLEVRGAADRGAVDRQLLEMVRGAFAPTASLQAPHRW